MANRKPQVGNPVTLITTIRDQDNNIINISQATTKQIILKSPSNIMTTKIADFDTDGVDGKIKYKATSSDLYINGMWHLQGYVVLPDGSWYTSKSSFEVEDNL